MRSNFFRLLCFSLAFYSCNYAYSAVVNEANHDFANMSCSDLMFGLIVDSSFDKTFSDSSMALAFDFERISNKYIMLKFVRTAGKGKGVIYGNFQLDLVDSTLKIIDPEVPIPITINKSYISFIKTKCTPAQNTYINTGAVPDGEGM